MKHKELRTYLEHILPLGHSVYIRGPAGVGKSETVQRVAKTLAERLNKEFVDWNKLSAPARKEYCDPANGKKRSKAYLYVDLRISQLDPCDIRGIPRYQDNVTEWVPCSSFCALSFPDSYGMLFMDELSQANEALQAAALQIFNDRTIGDTPVGEHVQIIAAGNRSQDRANSFDLSAPLCNRMAHFELTAPTAEDWANDFAYPAGLDHRVISHLRDHQDQLYATDKQIKESTNFAFNTPRSWTRCAAAIKDITDTNRLFYIASAYVGEGSAALLRATIEVMADIDIDAILRNPDKELPLIRQKKNWTALMWGITGVAVNRYVQDEKAFKSVTEVIRVLHVMGMTDFAAATLRMLRHCDRFKDQKIPEIVSKLMDVKGIRPVLETLKEILSE